ncbi:hypothetical protein ACQKWADRAFT_292165 [Trichoderma austrokoningii]
MDGRATPLLVHRSIGVAFAVRVQRSRIVPTIDLLVSQSGRQIHATRAPRCSINLSIVKSCHVCTDTCMEI